MIFFFFFQAEDGIRDGHVTGVQTCALPICDVAIVCVGNNPMLNGRETEDRSDITLPEHQQKLLEEVYKVNQNVVVVVIGSYPFAINWRSEERRVGKECRAGWWR